MGNFVNLIFSDDPKKKVMGYVIYAGFCVGVTYLSGKLLGKVVAREVVKKLI